MGYESPNEPHTETDGLSQPFRVFHFVLTYFANSWDAHVPNTSPWPSVSEIMTTLAIAATLIGSAWCLWRPTAFSLLQIALLGNLLFGLGSAAMTAVGRLQYGEIQAIALRYQTPALVFWGALASLMAVSLDWTRPRRLLLAQATLLILMAVGAGRWRTVLQWAEKRQSRQEIAWNALVANPSNQSAAGKLFYEPDMLKTLVPYLHQHHWGPPGKIGSSCPGSEC